MNKPKTPGHCGFPLANPHDAPGVDFVPYIEPIETLDKFGISGRDIFFLKCYTLVFGM